MVGMSRLNACVRLSLALLIAFAVGASAHADAPPKKRKSGKAKTGVAKATGSKPASKKANNEAKYSKFDKSGKRTNLQLVSDKNLGRPLTTAELDELVADEAMRAGVEKSERKVGDDVFLRRAYLDVIGRLPAPAEIEEYVLDGDPEKKAKLIDKLLAENQYGERWAYYWRDAINYRATAGANRLTPFRHCDQWLADQFNRNVPWDAMVRSMLTARGNSDEVPQGFFLAAHEGKAEELAGETARVFLGLQIACAQCHDHPTDPWLRDQFHELAAFFGKVAVRPRRQQPSSMGGPTAAIFERQVEYRKPDLENPSEPGEVTAPVFLTGQAIPMATNDAGRRTALANFVVGKRNPYFARAFVNRVWCELMGAGFVTPVDDLGGQKEAVMPRTFEALSRSFASSNYDVKRLLRTILNSRLYERKLQDSESTSPGEPQFRSVAPTRLASDQIFDAVDWVLGKMEDGGPNTPRRPNARGSFKQVFGVDPSLDKSLVEGSIPQALVLMNNPTIQARVSATREGTLLAKLLKANADDRDVVRMLYLRVLARKPTTEETYRATMFVQEVGDRGEAFEDLLWALLNSTEFLYKH